MSTPNENKDLPVDEKTTPQPSNDNRTYAILQETSGEESESWLYFIKHQGNEEALVHLNKQLQKIDWYIVDDLSTFDLEIDYLVSERTAKEMSKVDLNHYSFHRKFDGKLKKIDLGIKDHHSNEKKMSKVFDVLGYGKIEDYIDEEDIDPEDINSESNSDESDSVSDSDSNSESESENESKREEETKSKKKGKLPDVVSKKPPKIEIPRFAKAKAKRRNN
jgi:hypothetical protein